MASAWGLAWGQAWNGAWGAIDGSTPPEPPTPPAAAAEQPRGQIPWLVPPHDDAERKRRSRIAHGIIKEVAKIQVEHLDLDEVQRQQQLAEELRIRGLELETEYLALLNAERQRLIDAEIYWLMEMTRRRVQADEDAAAILLAIAAATD